MDVARFTYLIPLLLVLSSCWPFWGRKSQVFEGFSPTDAALKLQEAPVMETGGVKRHLSLGNQYYMRGMLEEAIAEYKSALAQNPRQLEAMYNLGIAYSQKGLQEEAIRQWRRTLEIDPSHGDAHYGLALAYLEEGKLDMAIEELGEVLRLAPDNGEAHLLYGQLLEKKGLKEEAREAYRKASELNKSQ